MELHLSYVTINQGILTIWLMSFLHVICFASFILFLPILLSLFFMFIKLALKERHLHACMLIIDLYIATNEY